MSLPFWARAADVLGLLALAFGFGLTAGGSLVVTLGSLRLSVSSGWRALLVGVLLLAIRHWRWPRPAAHQRIAGAWRRAWVDPNVRRISAFYWTIRGAVLLAGYLATVTFGLPEQGPFRVSANEFLNLPARFDAGWYLQIATDGYRYDGSDRQQNIVFMPALPLAMRVAGTAAGVNHLHLKNDPRGSDRSRLLWTGVVLSLLAGWFASVWIYRLALRWLDAERAVGAVLLMQAYPFALFYGAAYTEGLFLLASVGALLAFLRGAWPSAVAWGLLAGFTRPNGFVLSVPLGLLLLGHLLGRGRSDGSQGGAWRPTSLAWPLAATLAPALSTLAYSAYIYRLTGDPFVWTRLQSAWGREYRSLGTLAGEYVDFIGREGLYGYTMTAPTDAMNLAAALLALAAVYPVWRRFGAPYAAYILAVVLPPLMMGGVLSMGRFSAVLFPVFLWLGAVTPPQRQLYVVTAFAALQGLAATLYFTWRPLY